MTDPTNESTDELFQRLAAADPIEHDALPSADDPSARTLLENTMTTEDMTFENQNLGNQNLQNQSSGHEQRLVTDPVDASQFQFDHSTKQPQRQGRGMLLGAAAAVLLLVGGLLVFSPDNTPSAVAAVHNAATASLDADTARITTTFSLEGTDGTEAGQISGQFDAAYADDDLSFSLALDELQFDGDDDVPSLDDLPISEARLVDDIIYVEVDGEWLAVDTEGVFGQVVDELADPRTVLETVQELTEATEVGTADIDGVATTHFQSVVDLGDESLSQAGWLAFEGLPVDAEGEVTVDLYVDGDGLLRQLDLTGDVQDTSGTNETGTFDISTVFYDIGADFTVEAPEGVEPLDVMESLFNDE